MSSLGFWNKVKKPVFVLAPMADVTDSAFRRVIAKYGKPDVLWTEFVSADGLCSKGRKVLLKSLGYSEAERPIVAQLFTSNPEKMKEAARLVATLGFDGLDINMGCPDRSIEKQKSGAAMMKDHKLALSIIQAAKAGIKEAGSNIPVSVKTRLGYNKDELESWLPILLSGKPAVITIHARTRKEMSKVSARWERIKRAVEIRDNLKSETLIFGNGDVSDLADARLKVKQTGCDGVMLGRAVFGNPWLFSEQAPSVKQKLEVLSEHTRLFEKLLGKTKSFAVMKKHFKAYVSGFDGAKELRAELMSAMNKKEVVEMIKGYLSKQ